MRGYARALSGRKPFNPVPQRHRGSRVYDRFAVERGVGNGYVLVGYCIGALKRIVIWVMKSSRLIFWPLKSTCPAA